MKFVGPWTVHNALFATEKSTFAVTVHWTVREKKKKKTQNTDGWNAVSKLTLTLKYMARNHDWFF